MFRIICLAAFAGAVVALALIALSYFKDKSLVIPYIIFFVFIAVLGVSAFLHIKGVGSTAEDPSEQPSPQGALSSQTPAESDNIDETVPPSDNVNETVSPEELLAFDEKTWSDFKKLYTAHNSLMDAMQKYADGQITALAFYDYCEESKKFFADASLSFFYGETDYQETYLSAFQSMALSDQMAASSLMEYLDTFKISDLSKAQDNINQATEAATTIASNRGKLLVMAGLSDEEIHAKVEADTADLN